MTISHGITALRLFAERHNCLLAQTGVKSLSSFGFDGITTFPLASA